MRGTLSCCDEACHKGLVHVLYQQLQLTSQHSQRCSLRQWSGYVPSLRVDVEQGAHVGPPCDFTARSSLNQHVVPSLVWSHLDARSPDGQLADEEVGLLVHCCLFAHLLCALVGSATSSAGAVGDLRARSETHQLTPGSPCSPQGVGQGLVELVPPKWEGVEFPILWLRQGIHSADLLASGLLRSHPPVAQCGEWVLLGWHRHQQRRPSALFQGMFMDLLSVEVVQVLLTTFFLDGIGSSWWRVGVLSVRPGFSCHFGWWWWTGSYRWWNFWKLGRRPSF